MAETGTKNGWRTYRFGEMATIVNDRADNPADAGVDRYVGLEHLDADSLKIHRWGSPSDVSATKLRFRKGDIILGRRRVYQRKLAVADFDGICSAHAMVLRPKTEVVLSEFLPFFMQSDLFMDRAKEISVGSLSPTINWKTLAQQTFALPPLEEQRRMAEAAWAMVVASDCHHRAASSLEQLRIRFALQAVGATAKPGRDLQETSLGTIAHVIMGQSPPGSSYNTEGEGIPLLNGPTEFGLHYPTTQQYTTKPTRVCEPGDVLFCVRGSVGRLNIADQTYCIGRGLAAIRAKDGMADAKYLEVALTALAFSVLHEATGAGSTFPNITSQRLRAQVLSVQSIEMQRELGERYSAIQLGAASLRLRADSARDLRRRILNSIGSADR